MDGEDAELATRSASHDDDRSPSSSSAQLGLGGLDSVATEVVWPLAMTEVALNATIDRHQRLLDTLATVRSSRDDLEKAMSQNAETFEKLPVYTAKITQMAKNMKIVRHNVERLKALAHTLRADVKEVCTAQGTPCPELDAISTGAFSS